VEDLEQARDRLGDPAERVWKDLLDRLATQPPGSAAVAAVAAAIQERLRNGHMMEDWRNFLNRKWLDLQVAETIARLRKDGMPNELTQQREKIVDVLLTWAEDRLTGMSSKVLRDHFARLVKPPSNLTSTFVFRELLRESLEKALKELTPKNFTHFLNLARVHLFRRLWDWTRSRRRRRPALEDPHTGVMASASAREPSPDLLAEAQEALWQEVEKLPAEDRVMFSAWYDTETEIPEIAVTFFEGDECLAEVEVIRILECVMVEVAAKLGLSLPQLRDHLRQPE
jgi:hypothetical protein